MALIDAADIFADLVEEFGLGTITYRRGTTEVTGVAAIQLDVDANDLDAPDTEYTTRWYVPLQSISATFGAPQQRDEIVAADGTIWVVVDSTNITQANACEVFCVRKGNV